jgi:hypothetical protein
MAARESEEHGRRGEAGYPPRSSEQRKPRQEIRKEANQKTARRPSQEHFAPRSDRSAKPQRSTQLPQPLSKEKVYREIAQKFLEAGTLPVIKPWSGQA